MVTEIMTPHGAILGGASKRLMFAAGKFIYLNNISGHERLADITSFFVAISQKIFSPSSFAGRLLLPIALKEKN
jgi:hypothetical protein